MVGCNSIPPSHAHDYNPGHDENCDEGLQVPGRNRLLKTGFARFGAAGGVGVGVVLKVEVEVEVE